MFEEGESVGTDCTSGRSIQQTDTMDILIESSPWYEVKLEFFDTRSFQRKNSAIWLLPSYNKEAFEYDYTIFLLGTKL